ncbi:hypothetical protein MCOR02_000834 [Pyricularia oryzae]|nr:hypothetical protein MCOR02_000834 [Pyricularia oryzae]KAI6282522.1 hypothetical protein MCOR34_011079 [Pyricularia oryzae]KAI6325213.1 hypothetical protein MCOR29_003827 [Pyricularia oryzae]KAI6331229.1 hypothetical protein MCOR30_004924 [Pyricularia oryzae]KAI6379250.1 hypothetical protein MCOR31_000176 [Pyricularia oryzae]
MDHHPLQPNQSLIANLRSLTESEKWPEFDALEAEFNRSFAAGSEDARQLDEHDSLMLIMRDAEAGMHRALRTKTRWAAVEMARVKRVQVQADALMAEAKVMRDEAGREMKRAREVEDQRESDIARLEEVVASIKGRLGRIARERERRRLAQERSFKAAVGRLWQTVEVDEGQRVRPVVSVMAQQQPTCQVPFKRKHNTKPPLPLSHKQRKPPATTTTTTTDAPAPERWDASWLTPEPGLLGSVSWEQFRSDGSRYPLSKRWLCQRRPRVKGCRAPPRWLVFKCPAHPARVMDSQKELEKHYARDHADVASPAQRLRECGVHVRGCRQSLASSHNARITRDTYAMDWGSEGPVSGGEGRQGGRERVGRAVSEPAVDAWESCALWEGCDRDARSA